MLGSNLHPLAKEICFHKMDCDIHMYFFQINKQHVVCVINDSIDITQISFDIFILFLISRQHPPHH